MTARLRLPLRLAATTVAALALAAFAAPSQASATQQPGEGLVECAEVTEGSDNTIEAFPCEVVTWADGSGPYEVWDTTSGAGYRCEVAVVTRSNPPHVHGSFCALIA